ncbi:necrosis inducing protein [Chytriomyces sp. MP71]|nr:necrosis inducing protein [Chytriomyces sp. MP71]
MYSWFWPKDQEFFGKGHRYDWESVVVFVNNVNAPRKNQKLIKVAASAHGNYRKYAPPNPAVMQGTHAAIKYYTDGILDHSLDTYDRAPSGEHPFLPIIHWDQLSAAARETLQNFDFGNANVPFKDGNFQRNVDLANAA